jgi:hypothetical protein
LVREGWYGSDLVGVIGDKEGVDEHGLY